MYPRQPRKSRTCTVAAVKVVSIPLLWLPRSLTFRCLAVCFSIQTFLSLQTDLSCVAPPLWLDLWFGFPPLRKEVPFQLPNVFRLPIELFLPMFRMSLALVPSAIAALKVLQLPKCKAVRIPTKAFSRPCFAYPHLRSLPPLWLGKPFSLRC